MLIIPKEMHLNDFVDVRIQSVSTIFRQLGAFDPSRGSYSGDEVLGQSGRKTDLMSDMAHFEARQLSEESRLRMIEEQKRLDEIRAQQQQAIDEIRAQQQQAVE